MPRPTAFDRADITRPVRLPEKLPTFTGIHAALVVIASLVIAGLTVGATWATKAKSEDVDALKLQVAAEHEKTKATEDSLRELRIEFRDTTKHMTDLLVGIATKVGALPRPRE